MKKAVFFCVTALIFANFALAQSSSNVLNQLQNVFSSIQNTASNSKESSLPISEGQVYGKKINLDGICQNIDNDTYINSAVNSIRLILNPKVESQDKANNAKYINELLEKTFDDDTLSVSTAITERINKISLFLTHQRLNQNGELLRYQNINDRDQIVISNSQFTRDEVLHTYMSHIFECAKRPKDNYYLALYAVNPGLYDYDNISSFDQFNNIFYNNYPMFATLQNTQSANRFNTGSVSNVIDPKIASLIALIFTDYQDIVGHNLNKKSDSLKVYYNQNIKKQEENHAKLEAERKQAQAQQLQKDQELKAAKAAEDARQKEDFDDFTKNLLGDSDYNKSIPGQLVGAYQVFQLLEACHEGRKEFAQQLVTKSEYEIYKSKIKDIESRLLNLDAQLNTDDLWSKAESKNRNGQYRMSIGMESPLFTDLINLMINRESFGNVSSYDLCNRSKSIFSDFEKEIIGSPKMKKTF